MQLITKWNLRAAARVAGISAGAFLGAAAFTGAALADGPTTVTIQAPTTAQVATAPSANVSLGGAPASVTAAAPVQSSVATSPAGNVEANAAGASGSTSLAATRSGAAAQVNVSGVPAAASLRVNTAPSGNVQVGVGNTSASVNVGAPTSPQASGAPGTAQVNAGSAPLSAGATAPTTVSASTAPTSNVEANVAGNTVRNATTAPSAGSAVSCPYAGVNVAAAACGSAGSATAVLFAPSHAQGTTAPTTTTEANVAGNSMGNTTSAPAVTSHVTCPVVGVNVTGYGCAHPGSATAVGFAPTRGAGSTAPTTTTHAGLVGNSAHNTTSAPTNVSYATCPMAGVNASGYSCTRGGTATAVGFAPVNARAVTAPASSGGAHVAGVNTSHGAAAPTDASLTTCPLVGLGITGYGCWEGGSAAGLLFTPAGAAASTAPTSHAAANTTGHTLRNTTSAPAGANANTCPLIGIGVAGYGCAAPGSATALIFAPTSGQTDAAPTAHTGGALAGSPLDNTTSTPSSAGLNTCPLAGIDITGYGCGNPGSATGVLFAPTGGHLAADPMGNTQTSVLGAGMTYNTATSAAEIFGSCPMIGFDVTGYGCDTRGSATGVLSSSMSDQISSSLGFDATFNLPSSEASSEVGVQSSRIPSAHIHRPGSPAIGTGFIPAIAGLIPPAYGRSEAPGVPAVMTGAPMASPPAANQPAVVVTGYTVPHTTRGRIPSVPPLNVSRHGPHTAVGLPPTISHSAGGAVSAFNSRPSGANRAAAPGLPAGGANLAGSATGAGIAGMPRAGGADGFPTDPMLPILPFLVALASIGLGGLTRRLAVVRR